MRSVTFDWQAAPEAALDSGVVYLAESPNWPEPRVYLAPGDDRSCRYRFENFPDLYIDGQTFDGAVFDNCGKIRMDQCVARRCVFVGTGGFELSDVLLEDCAFAAVRPHNGCTFFLADSQLTGCRIQIVDLPEEAVLFRLTGDSRVDHCQFSGCGASRPLETLVDCEPLLAGQTDVEDYIDLPTCRWLTLRERGCAQ